jgi:4'-phosphopantetheinyl transferase EntD
MAHGLQPDIHEIRASPDLEALLPPGAVAFETAGPADPRRLPAAEAVHLGASVAKRAGEFAAGRLCARRALAAFGLGEAPIPVAPDRSPVWPGGIVGSISHTAGLCIAAVGATSSFLSIGVDCEVASHVGFDLWEALFTPAERRWLAAVPHASRQTAAAFLFSAKEAFYKCQFPLTGEWLEFKDVEVQPVDWEPEQGGFRICGNRTLALRTVAPDCTAGRYRERRGFVMTAMAIPAIAVRR